jgi:hypothetical protein
MAGIVEPGAETRALASWSPNATEHQLADWAAALEDGGPLRPEALIEWLTSVAAGRALVVLLECPDEPDQRALAGAIATAAGPVLGLLQAPSDAGGTTVIELRPPPPAVLARTLRTIVPLTESQALAHAHAHPNAADALAALGG